MSKQDTLTRSQRAMIIFCGVLASLLTVYLSASTAAYMERHELTGSAYLNYFCDVLIDIPLYPRPWSHHIVLPILGQGDVCYRTPFFNILCMYGIIVFVAILIASFNYIAKNHHQNDSFHFSK